MKKTTSAQSASQLLGILRLAAFGSAVLDAHRNPDPADVDGFTLEDLALKAGVLEPRQITEPCGDSCACADVGQIPGECFFVSDPAQLARELLAAGNQPEDGQIPGFPSRILELLREVADRKGTESRGPWEDGNGEPMQDDAEAAIAWLEAAADAIAKSESSRTFYKRRCDELQKAQSAMRDPERTMVCDILANGQLLKGSAAGDRYSVKTGERS